MVGPSDRPMLTVLQDRGEHEQIHIALVAPNHNLAYFSRLRHRVLSLMTIPVIQSPKPRCPLSRQSHSPKLSPQQRFSCMRIEAVESRARLAIGLFFIGILSTVGLSLVSYLRTSRELGESTPFPDRLVLTPTPSPTPEEKSR